MDFQLRAAQEKLEREQRERKVRAKSKMERENRAEAEAAQRAKRLDAARAQLEAERQMEESMLLGNGIVFSRMLEALSFDGFGDKIKLPPSCFQELSDQGGALVDESVGVTHSGVLEFTAKEKAQLNYLLSYGTICSPVSV